MGGINLLIVVAVGWVPDAPTVRNPASPSSWSAC